MPLRLSIRLCTTDRRGLDLDRDLDLDLRVVLRPVLDAAMERDIECVEALEDAARIHHLAVLDHLARLDAEVG
jgi:hypothetical protein